MTTLFQTNDPRGISVTCTREQWDGHILREGKVGGHEELRGHADLVNRTIASPLAIYWSTQWTVPYRRESYYRPSDLPPPFDHGFLKVVVEFVPSGIGVLEGRVVTAFQTDRPPGEEDELVWPTT